MRSTVSLTGLVRERYLLAGALMTSALLPLGFRTAMGGGLQSVGVYAPTTLMVCIGVMLSYGLVRALSRFPAPSALSISLPAVSASFASVMAVITLTHADYSRGLLLSGYVIAVMWFALVGAAKARILRPRLAIVPVGSASPLVRFGGVIWQTLASPSQEIATPLGGVVADLRGDLAPVWQRFLISCAESGTPVYDSTAVREMATGQVELGKLSDIGFDALLPHRVYLNVKLLIDFIGALLLLPLALLIIGIAMIAIRIESRGSAIFVQDRVGYRGRIFRCYKLRSMRPVAQGEAPPFTQEDDPRITRVGKFIRKYRIDELPQLFNILKGEMSWIGPRPESVTLSQRYEEALPLYRFRYAVRPGITGWAAVHQGNVGGVDAAATKLRYDFFYIKHLSLSLDLFIAFRTGLILITGFGAK